MDKNILEEFGDRYYYLQDDKNRKYLYDRDFRVLFSCNYVKYMTKSYAFNQQIPKMQISLGGKTRDLQLPMSVNAVKLFEGLDNLQICKYWNISNNMWRLAEKGLGYKYGRVVESKKNETGKLLPCLYIGMLYDETEYDSDEEILKDEFCLHILNRNVLNANTKELLGEGKDSHQINMKKTEDIKIDAEISELLKCDYIRCKLPCYDESILYDIKKGHWDVTEEMSDKQERKMYYRDPLKDIKEGVVGIDFGTKSTVVTRQDETNRIVPIRIGAANLSEAVKSSDYENPTIIECNDVSKFLKEYGKKKGRPNTSCDDLFVSYDAYSDFCTCQPREFYAYYTDIKQWSNKEKKEVLIQDKKDRTYYFKAVTREENTSINPIELYAYYIGMYINNMRNGVYLKYLLSYPVGYSLETRELIRESFKNGLMKSLPEQILQNEDCMKKFDVSFGISEPAAYAVTALELKQFDPVDENESYMYGIFDFGGGTTDFDFGIWRGASEEEYEIEGYDYVLKCFGADSDVTLGGENILEMLAYKVFKDNLDLARQQNIQCSLPYGEKAFLGSEVLLSDSQSAMRNLAMIKEELRPLWHQENEWKSKYFGEDESDETVGRLELTLYDSSGNPVPNCKLKINVSELLEMIRERITKGVRAFFRCMEKTFNIEEKTDEEQKVYIFLAGNSCKSIFVKEAFEMVIQEYYSKFKEVNSEAGKDYFELIQPLVDQNTSCDEYIPNGKTSVSYGLVKSREGSNIKIEVAYESQASQEARFRFYLGRERRKTFDCKLSPADTEYRKWVKFQGATKRVIRIYYTTDPMADSKSDKMSIENVHYKEIEIEQAEDKFLFLRSVDPNTAEYVVAIDEDTIITDQIQQITFED